MLRNNQPQTCRMIRLESNGQLVLEVLGQELPVLIHGLEIPEPVTELYRDIMTQRINWIEPSLRCVAVEPSRQPASLRISYLAAKDKSGDIWLDLATLLVEEGAARVARGTFSDREVLLAAEAGARARGLGIWGEGD